MKNLFKTIVMALFVIGLTNSADAQSKFEKATADAAKLEKKAKWDFPRERGKNGKGYTVYYPALKTPPKKVALVTFAVHDPGYSDKKNTAHATTFSSVRNSDETCKFMADSYVAVAIEPLKETYKEYGMELLTPEEFLDTDEKKTFYNEFEFESRKNFFNKVAVTNVNTTVAATGYRAFLPKEEMYFTKESMATFSMPMLECKNAKMMESLGHDLCKGLEVDAVVIVYTTVMTKNQIKSNIMYVTMAMFGPNPVELAEGKKDGALYRKGLYYGVARVKIDTQTTDKKQPGKAIITAGYENIMKGLSHKLGKWLTEKTAEEDKRK